MFFRPPIENINNNEYPEIMSMLEEITASTIAPEEQKSYLQQLYQFYNQFKLVIQSLNTEEKIASLLNTCASMMKEVVNQTSELKNLAPLAASSFLANASTVSAETYQAFEGRPPGGLNLCQGLLNCIEGYLINAGGTITVAYNLYLNPTTNIGAQWVYNTCLKNPETIGNILKNILEQNSTTSSETFSPCAATLNDLVKGVNIGSQVQQLSTQACHAYQNYLKSTGQSCLTPTNVMGYNAAIFCIFLAAVICCACAVLACKLTPKITENMKNSCTIV